MTSADVWSPRVEGLISLHPRMTEGYARFRQVLDLLDDPSLISLGELSSRCALSERSLQRMFQEYCGVGVKRILIRARIRDAVAAIDHGWDRQLSDLAADASAGSTNPTSPQTSAPPPDIHRPNISTLTSDTLSHQREPVSSGPIRDAAQSVTGGLAVTGAWRCRFRYSRERSRRRSRRSRTLPTGRSRGRRLPALRPYTPLPRTKE